MQQSHHGKSCKTLKRRKTLVRFCCYPQPYQLAIRRYSLSPIPESCPWLGSLEGGQVLVALGVGQARQGQVVYSQGGEAALPEVRCCRGGVQHSESPIVVARQLAARDDVLPRVVAIHMWPVAMPIRLLGTSMFLRVRAASRVLGECAGASEASDPFAVVRHSR